MTCERIRELILTDYTDAEAAEALRREVDAHLASCASCRDFAHLIAEKAVMPFKAVRTEEPPAYLWQRIKGSIAFEGAGQRSSFLLGVAGLIRNVTSRLARIPRPALAFAAAAAVVIAILITRPVMQERALNEYLDDQMTFLAMLDAEESNGYFFDTDTRTWTERVM